MIQLDDLRELRHKISAQISENERSQAFAKKRGLLMIHAHLVFVAAELEQALDVCERRIREFGEVKK